MTPGDLTFVARGQYARADEKPFAAPFRTLDSEPMKIDLIDTTSDYIPLSLFYLKSYAESDPVIAGHCTIDVFTPTEATDIERTVGEIVSRAPDVVGFSCYIWNNSQTMEICRRVKAEMPDVTIVLGGPDVSSVPEKTINENDFVDVVVRGEGEETFRELLQLWIGAGRCFVDERLDSVPGLAFQRAGELVMTDRRPFIDDLDVIPSPYLNGCIDLATEKRTILFETYRGCPFKCSFCFYPKDYGNLLHSFSLDRVEQDLRDILRSGVRSIFLMDPTFNIPPKRAKRILQIIAEHKQFEDLSVTVELRVDLLDREFMDMLKAAGIGIVEIGLQSSNDTVLRAVDHKQSMRKITENVAYLQSIGIDVVCQLIYGLPEGSYAEYLESLDFSICLDASKIEPYRLQLLPGTPMYQNAELLGLNFVDAGSREIISTRTMSAVEIDRAGQLTELLECFYDNSEARHSFRWLAHQVDRTYAVLLDEYLTWRQAQPMPFEGWREEGSRHLDAFIRSLGSSRPDEVAAVSRDLLRYDFYISPSVDIRRDTICQFDYAVDEALGAEASFPRKRQTWLLFHTTDSVASNFFNGTMFRKSYRRLTPKIMADPIGACAKLEPREIMAIARWHLLQGNLKQAEKIARQMSKNGGNNADASYVLGAIAAETGDFQTALDHLRRAVDLAPGDAGNFVAIGNILSAMELFEEARDAYRGSLELDPNLVEPTYNFGVISAMLERNDEAIRAFEHVIELQPDFAEGHFGLGEVLCAAGRADEAVAAYERALVLKPDFTDAAESLEAARQQRRQMPPPSGIGAPLGTPPR